jgi:hypothetical protein
MTTSAKIAHLLMGVFVFIALVSLACSQPSDLTAFLASPTPAPTRTPSITPTPMTPPEMLKESGNRMKALGSYKEKYTVKISVPEVNFNFDSSSAVSYQSPDTYYSVVTENGLATEGLVIGMDVYTRTLNAIDWNQMPSLDGEGHESDLEFIYKLLDSAVNITLAGETTISNYPCYYFLVDVRSDQLIQLFELTDVTPVNELSTNEFWIGKDDLLLRQWKLTMNLNLSGVAGVLTSDALYYSFNEQIKLPDPPKRTATVTPNP